MAKVVPSFASLALAGLLALASSSRRADAFVPSFRLLGPLVPPGAFGTTTSDPPRASSSTSSLSMAGGKKSLVVVSPPGGVGEVAAVSAATSGHSVKWFVVNSPSSSTQVRLPSSVLAAVEKAGGSVELAGADSDSLLLPPDDADSAAGAVGRWCGSSPADGLIATLDGVDQSEVGAGDQNAAEGRAALADAVKVAAREASAAVAGGRKVAVLPAPTGEELARAEEEESGGGLGGVLGGLLGVGGKADVPASLGEALGGGEKGAKATTLRYGELFGLPESSPEASPFVGGPRLDPVLRDEYTMRSVRIDPTLSATGASMMDAAAARSSRLSVGEAAALLALGEVDPGTADAASGVDVCLTSLRGADSPTVEEWAEEFASAVEALASGAAAASGSLLFRASFGSVPDVPRLTEWIASKWAPAVLRTYDIAGIRVGARPVYAAKISDTAAEIVWQKLENFESVTVGRMIVEVDDAGLTARRGPGDPAGGYGGVSPIPLNGEDVLVRRLADAASQAVEKGLARKAAKAEKKPKAEPKKAAAVAAAAPAVTTVAASGTVSAEAAPAAASTSEGGAAGPRAAGARRSSERTRGRRRRARAAGASSEASASPSSPEKSEGEGGAKDEPEAFQ